MPPLGLRLETLIRFRLKVGDAVYGDASFFEGEEEYRRWYALGLILGALGVKKHYDPDPKIDEVIEKLNQLDPRPKESLQTMIEILEEYLKEIGEWPKS
ncbi:MAG: hypothetical protein QW707_06205 [Candidatus Bathyarchaeia archaeon]